MGVPVLELRLFLAFEAWELVHIMDWNCKKEATKEE
jgi:hypothetical protein